MFARQPVCRSILLGFTALLPSAARLSLADETVRPLQRIAFGSCANQFNPCPIWASIADYRPDLLLLLGDNVYADLLGGRLVPATAERIAEAYERLAGHPDFARLRQQVPIMATWDDHDYGHNDAGVEWELKDVSAQLFHDFLGTPPDSPRRQQQGVYHAEVFGPPGRRIQVIMLDTRYFRSPLEQADEPLPGWRSRPYRPATGSEATILGADQWQWLGEQLRQPAQLRLIGSSIQVLSDEHPFEMWANFPEERYRLFELIRQTGAGGVIILSGDRHLGDISLDDSAVGYPLFDVTASGFNQAHTSWRPMEPNARRVAGLNWGHHFGSIEIDWEQVDPLISLQLRDEKGRLAVQTQVPLSVLSAPSAEPPLPEGIVSPRRALTLPAGADVSVQFRVAAGRAFADTGRILLNSMTDFRHIENLTVVINASALSEQYAGATFDSFKGKSIRASGKISLYRGQKQIVVDRADQLELID